MALGLCCSGLAATQATQGLILLDQGATDVIGVTQPTELASCMPVHTHDAAGMQELGPVSGFTRQYGITKHSAHLQLSVHHTVTELLLYGGLNTHSNKRWVSKQATRRRLRRRPLVLDLGNSLGTALGTCLQLLLLATVLLLTPLSLQSPAASQVECLAPLKTSAVGRRCSRFMEDGMYVHVLSCCSCCRPAAWNRPMVFYQS